jgi:membrane-bound metal-dependent hydrolase YbcI (DUF457 family)
MDLPTHLVFGVAIGFVFFGRPEIALLIGLGALLPDLDREYWFIGRQAYREEQYHRALLHNVFILALTYLVSPFLSLGVFLHILQDSFTTSKDRGCEWLYPISRLVKLGMYDADGHLEPLDPNEHVYFYQQDPHGLLEYADLDFREEGPVPWRRVYGPALNSSLLDRGFLLGSIAIMAVWLFAPDNAHLGFLLDYPLANYAAHMVGYVAVAILYAAGELDRMDKPLRIPRFNFVKYPIFATGIALFGFWLILSRDEISANLHNMLSSPISILLGALLIIIVAVTVIVWQTKLGKAPAIV